MEGGKSLEKGVEAVQGESCHLSSVDEDCSKEITKMILELKHSVSEFWLQPVLFIFAIIKVVGVGLSKKSQKKKRRDMDSSKSKKSLEKKEESNQDDVYLISSEDEGSPKGMKSMKY